MLRSIWAFPSLLTLGFSLALTPIVHAEYVAQTVILDQSNQFSDGIKYGSVTIEAFDGKGSPGGGLSSGQVRITYSADMLASYGEVLFFGINSVGFNTDLALKKKQIQGPSFWILDKDEKLDGFGRFTWADTSPLGILRNNPVSLLISDLGADATLDHFLIGAKLKDGSEPKQGSSIFAAHVVGIEVGESSFRNHWIGQDADVFRTPEPATLTLAAFGMSGMAFFRFLRRRQRSSKPAM